MASPAAPSGHLARQASSIWSSRTVTATLRAFRTFTSDLGPGAEAMRPCSLWLARATGQDIIHATRFKNRKEPPSQGQLGKAPSWMKKKEQLDAWKTFRERLDRHFGKNRIQEVNPAEGPYHECVDQPCRQVKAHSKRDRSGCRCERRGAR